MLISATATATQIALRFQDSGPGIAAADHERIFEPFHTTRSNGTGLGLAVARAVARAHGGDLVLEQVEQGACFVLHLPIVAATQAASSAAIRIPSQPLMAGN
mgnify:CR=1 FL=1